MSLAASAATLALPWVLLARVLSRLPLGHEALLQKGCGWGLEKHLPLLPSLSHWDIFCLALEVAGFHSGLHSFTCSQLCASSLDKNGNGGSAVFPPSRHVSATAFLLAPVLWAL